MPKSSLGPISGRDSEYDAHPSTEAPAVNFSYVLVVGKSAVNRVVVSKIVERSGLKPVQDAPETAAKTFDLLQPGIVIVDGGATNDECDPMLSHLRDQRRASKRDTPFVILLSTKNCNAENMALGHVLDAIVAKPITTDSLQPVIDRLLERARR